jgi:hypothetical protein
VAIKKRRLDGGVTRREFADLSQKVEECARNQDLQFTRIAQIQAELDHIRVAWARSESRKR